MNKKILESLYLKNKLSVKDIAHKFGCSSNRVDYWIKKYRIKKRTISQAIYQMNNPLGDPFSFRYPKSKKDIFLYGLGIGLYWGEGFKKSTYSVRLSNTDPYLIKAFIKFLIKIYKIDKNRPRFQILSYNDLKSNELVHFWSGLLDVKDKQFSKTTILNRRGSGTYSQKMKHGVLIVYFNNTKLRNLINSQIAEMKNL